ncbi:MAG: sigma 54-interacting transcriptional regulator [Deltaproteobacteria bacterium]|nr:sigma 54-interacting transcriptional regulator [Deltaproteobacteria bacterium]
MFDFLSFLSEQPERLREFLDRLGEAMFVVDKDQKIVYWNKQAAELTGYAVEEVLGQHCLKGIRCVNCLYDCSLFTHGELDGVRTELATKDGRQVVVSKNAFVLRNAEGEAVAGIEWLKDESDLVAQIDRCKMQRETISERERLQAAVLGSIREGVLTIDRDWRITSFSRRAEVITGFAATEAVGRFCHEVIGSRLCKSGCPAQHCLETGDDEAERTTQIQRADGKSLAVAEVAVPLKDEEGRAIGSLILIEDRAAQAAAADSARTGAQFAGMIGRSEPMRAVFRVVEQVARTDVTVLVTGESGTGKEMVARALHTLSGRRHKPFQAINCAALPETLMESELFGHVRGAFTGAIRDRVGRIEEAEGGTLFLDEIGELSPGIQAKLLRFLQEREYQRLGESSTRAADVRVVCATNRDLARAVEEGEFREDLYYRIRVIPVELPPLRDRRDDLPLLAAHLLEEVAVARGRPALSLSPSAQQRLMHHAWPGNVRELINALEFAVAMAPGRRIRPEDLPPELSGSRSRYSAGSDDLQQEAERIREALARHDGNRTRTAQFLGMDRVTLYRKMKKHGIS